MEPTSVKPKGLGAFVLVICLSAGVNSVSADPPPPAYLSQRSGKINPESISLDEALWAAFVTVSGWEASTAGQGAKFLQSVGLSPADASALSNHIEAAISDVNGYTRELMDNLCANKATIQTSQALYVQALQDIDSKTALRQAALTGKVNEIISPGGKDRFYNWVSTQVRSNLTLVSVDHAKRVAFDNVDSAIELERLCTSPGPTKGPTAGQSQSSGVGTNGDATLV